MKVYKLPYVVFAPGEGENDEDDKYVAEIPILPGCRAWGDTAEQAVEYLESVAQAYIASCRDRGWPLPLEVEARLTTLDVSPDEVLVRI